MTSVVYPVLWGKYLEYLNLALLSHIGDERPNYGIAVAVSITPACN